MQAFSKSGASVKSRFDEEPLFNVEDAKQPVKPSAVVDPSAKAVDPTNEKFVPANKQELKLSVQAILSDLEDVQVARVYELIKDSIRKMRDEEQKMKKKNNSVEETIRQRVRSILSEVELPPVKKIPFGVSGSDFLQRMKTSLKRDLKNMQLDDNEKIIDDIAARVKKNDPLGSIKRAARYLKDNVAGDVGTNLNAVISAVESSGDFETAAGMRDALKANPGLVPKSAVTGETSRDELAQAFKVKHGTNIRDIEDKAMQKFKKVAVYDTGTVELKDDVDVLVMLAMQDFVKYLETSGSWLYGPDDIEVMKNNPAIAAEMGSFRVFLDPYIEILMEDPEDSSLRQYAAKLGAKTLEREAKKLMSGKPGELDIPGIE